MTSLFIYLLLLLYPSAPDVHDIHVSVANIYRSDKGHIELETKIFFDDLQMGVGLEPRSEIPPEYGSSDLLIENFVKENLQISFDGAPVRLRYKESYLAEQAVWSIFTISSRNKDPKKILIENSILTDLYDDQINILNIDLGTLNTTISFNGKKVKKEVFVKD